MTTPKKQSPLIPSKHPQHNCFYTLDIPGIALKDNQQQLEHPFFTLNKKPDHLIRTYKHRGNMLRLVPGGYGLPSCGLWARFNPAIAFSGRIRQY